MSPRSQIGLELEAIAESYISRWDEFAGREWKSDRLGFDYVSRQTEFEENIYTVAKAFVPGLTLEHHRHFRENVSTMLPLFDDRLSAEAMPDFEGRNCTLSHIKMPMMISNRSIVSLYYNYDKPDGSVVSINSSRGTDAIVEQHRNKIKRNVVANNILQYTKLTPRDDGCDFV